jgi:hypothetical protein
MSDLNSNLRRLLGIVEAAEEKAEDIRRFLAVPGNPTAHAFDIGRPTYESPRIRIGDPVIVMAIIDALGKEQNRQIEAAVAALHEIARVATEAAT